MSDADLLYLHPIVVGRASARWLDLPTLIAPDFPGHGARGHPPADLTIDAIVDEVAGWIHRPVHVIGALMGGIIGFHLALRHPELVRSLVLADTSSEADRSVMLRRAELAASGDRQVDATLDQWFGSATMGLNPLPEPVAYARDALASIPLATLTGSWRAMASHNVTAQLDRITMPTTVLAGEYDVVNPPDGQARLAHALPIGRLTLIQAQHMAPLDNPAEFSRAVLDHVRWAESFEEA